MGKVLSTFDIGWPGAISRSVDDIVVSMKNGGAEAIPFGAPVFLTADGEGVAAYDPDASPAQTFASFVGFAVRSAGKTPDTYPARQDMSSIRSDQSGAWNTAPTSRAPGTPARSSRSLSAAVSRPRRRSASCRAAASGSACRTARWSRKPERKAKPFCWRT